MDLRIIRTGISLLLLSFTVEASESSANETWSDDPRQPRVSGRIVKLYSGTKPEPIYCANEGFQADPANCAVFYRCVRGANNKYTVFRFQCGPGTIYDPETEVCNFPRNTKRSECGSFAPPSIEKEEHKENEIEGAQSELPSPISTRPETVTSAPSQAPQFTEHTRPVWMTTGASQAMPPKPTVGPQPGRQEGDACTTDGFMGDSENCRKFYRCVGNQRGGFIRYEFMCSDTTVWDDDVQSCNHPWAVQRSRCGRGVSNGNTNPSEAKQPSSQNSHSPNTVQQQLQMNYGQKVSQTQTQISHGPVNQNQTQINYGDGEKKDENTYVTQNQTQISHGSAVSQSQTQINHANNGVQTQLQIDHTKESSQSQSQVYETTLKTTPASSNYYHDEPEQGYGPQPSETQRPIDKDDNNNECSDSGFMGDSNDCKKFYRCVDNGRGGFIKYEFSCGEGTVWDSSIEACNHAWAVKNCGGKAPQSSPQGESSSSTATTTTTTQYYQTTSESSLTEEESDTGYGNQNQQQSSDQASSSTSTEQPKSTTDQAKPSTASADSSDNSICKSSGFMGDSKDCKKFYRCVDNGNGGYTKYEFKCGEGTVWDPEIGACNHVWAVKSCGGSSDINKEESTTSTQSTVITTATLIEPTTQPASQIVDYDSGYRPGPEQVQQGEDSSTTTSTTKRPSSGSNDDNECKSSGFMGDKNDCKKFYRCVDSGNGNYIRYEFSCGEGTVWDSKIDACNHAWAVENCGGDGDDIYKETTSNPKPISNDEEVGTTSPEKETDKPMSPTSTDSSEKPHTTAKPSQGKECSQEGFMGDDEDCKKFYRCVDNGSGGYTKYEFSCGEGTLWDSEINACNHANEVKRPCTSTSSTQNENVSESSTESATDTSSTLLTTNELKPTVKPSTSKPSSSKECTQEGFMGDENDCKKFYRCVDNGKGGFTKYEFTCGEGTVWDPEITACNHPQADGQCKGSAAETSASSSTEPNREDDEPHTESSSTSTSSSTEQGQTTTTSQRPQQSSDDKCTSEGFFGNSKDCKKFYRCVDNGKGGYTKYDFTCGDGTVWVQEIQACDHDDGENSCGVQSGSSSTTSASTDTNDQQLTTSSTNLPDTTQKPIKEDEDSQNEISNEKPTSTGDEICTDEGFYPDTNDCKRFYRCVDNGKGGFTKYDFACGEGTAWDSDIQSCNHIDQVQSCQNSGGNEQQNVQEDESQSSGTTTSTSGPATEGSKPASKDTCQQEGYYGNTQDCTKFYRCVDNGKGGLTKYDFDCGEGTIWDQDVTTCNHPQDVAHPSCQQSDSSGSSTASSSSTESSQSSSSTTESSSNSSDCSSTTKKPSNKDINCTKEGYYANPNDCKKFYRCVDWDGDGKRFSVYHFECGEGTIWDPALDTCNHEDSVYPPRDCSGGESQSENVGSEGTDSSTDETTTTEKSTTEHETTTQESSEQTTAETTTQQSTTAEQTTTQQTTEQTTQSTEKTTTEKTTEHTTTQENNEPTTTQQTTEQTNTQESNEQTTTQETEEQTTQESTTQQTTTQESTTSEQTTTHQTTTEQSTTEQTTEHSDEQTTQESTTQQSQTTSTAEDGHETTTHESTEATTQESTTQSSTDETESETTEDSETTEGTTESTHESTTESEQESTTESEQESTTQTAQESTTEDKQESTTEGGEVTTESSSSDKDCPETEDDQNLFVCPTSFKRHPKYCNMFYQCTEDYDTHDLQIATFRCPNDTIYDESQTKCVEEKKADKKCDGEIAQKRRVKRGDIVYKEPIVVTNERLKCPAAGHYPFEKQECSPAFLKCQKTKAGKLRGFVYQCPENHVYWSVSRRCEPKSYVRDCKRSYNIWTGRWEIPIERRNVAP